MRKKILSTLLISCLFLSLTACGEKKVESEKEVSVHENSEEPESEAPAVNNEESSDSQTDDSKTGTVQQGDGYIKVPVITDKELNYTGSAGPMNYSIDAIQISNLTATTDSAADMFGIEKDKEVAVVVMNVTAENTSEEDVDFYISQAVLISNTKEQADPNLWLSDYIDGEFLGQVVKTGSICYILPNSNANDITSITLRISGPTDADWNSLSDDISIELSFE